MPDSHIGESVTRLEDDALLTGTARFVDDIRLDGMAHAAFVRSPFAHATLGAIDTEAARAMPGVLAVYTIDDLRDVITQDRIPEGFPKPPPRKEIGAYVLARDEVCYVGEPVAAVIAESRYQAEDAAQCVDVEYDPLPVVSDCRLAADPQSPRADTRQGDNVVTTVNKSYGDIESAFANAPHKVRETLYQHRGVAMSMECRGAVVRFDPICERLTMWASAQAPHSHQSIITFLFGLTEGQVRIIIPNLGGGFGPKLNYYPEDAVITAATLKLGRPVKWVEDRREHLLTTTQERDQVWEVEIAADEHGRVLGLRGRLYHDQGAYIMRGINIPFSASTTILGPYVIPAYNLDVTVTHTNKVPVTSMRGAGHPQGCFTMERLMDRVAQKTGVDRAVVRQRNMITPDQMPYEQPLLTQAGQKIVYDSGDYERCQSALLDAIDYASFAERQKAARAEGRYLGIGIANYVKSTGRGPFETGLVRIGTSGKISVYTGATAMGQGFHTAMAQICADQLGVDPKDVTVIAGDTDTVAMGIGSFASRATVCAGSSIHLAATEVRKKVLAIAANLLEASSEDLELVDGKVFVKGVPGLSVSFAQIADAVAGIPGVSLPEGMSAGVEAEVNFQPENVTYANGAHAAEVEVDPGTGAVRITRYIVVHDSGRLINPMIVDGQVQGGVTLGVGHALFEWMIYDDEGQPQTTNLAEYLVPTAPEVPRYEIVHEVSPTDRNPIGVKGVGECGVMSAAPSVISAIEDALAPFGVSINRYPITPAMLVEQIAASGAGESMV